MRTLKLTLQYDGTEYVGWQRQGIGRSIQGLLEEALQRFEGSPVTVHGAGRTDAGVHALGQVASVSLAATIDTPTLTRALNAVLPPDVRVLDVAEETPSFHARFSAVGKVYEYRIVNAPLVSPFVHRYAWHVIPPLDLDAMREGSEMLIGAHDFAAFQGSGSAVQTTERVIRDIEWEDGGGYDLPLVMRIRGDGFLRHMVRNIVGTLVEVGLGRWTPTRVAAIRASLDRSQAGPTAPPQGLFLVRVLY
ncbi:MAG TPA: tRNA pseudouridine(38-40) synthase TruA [Vicinamibacterales bacterium]